MPSSISLSDQISLAIAIVSAIISCVALWLTYLNLKEIKNQFAEQNRGVAVFYINTRSSSQYADLIIKNFGNSPVTVTEINCNPPITWKNVKRMDVPLKTMTELTNIFLAPNQSISSEFDIYRYPDKFFNINIKYITCGKKYSENYTIDLSYIGNSVAFSENFNDKDLKIINDSIQELSDRFR